jgi:superfamily I DNA/RNA helicase
MMQYTQAEFLQIIKQYNSTDRKIIKANLKHIMDIYGIKPADIIALGYSSRNVYAWTNRSTSNIPLFEQALNIAVKFNFSITEFLK